MATLHLGTFLADELITLLPKNLTVHRDGDSWEEWGEGRPDSHPEHITFTAEDPIDLMRDVTYLLSEAPGLLMPMAYSFQRGCIAAITDSADWSLGLWSVESAPVKTWLHYNAQGDDLNLWENPEWLAYIRPGFVPSPTRREPLAMIDFGQRTVRETYTDSIQVLAGLLMLPSFSHCEGCRTHIGVQMAEDLDGLMDTDDDLWMEQAAFVLEEWEDRAQRKGLIPETDEGMYFVYQAEVEA